MVYDMCTLDVLDDQLLSANFLDRMGAPLINTFIVVLPILVAFGEVAANGFHGNVGVSVFFLCIILTTASG